MSNQSITVVICILLLLLQGCGIYEQDGFEEVVVVEAYAEAGERLPDVRLSTNLPVDQEYSFENVALSGATVTITRLDENGAAENVFEYRAISEGVYRSRDRSTPVEAGKAYRLDVTFADRPDELTAVTNVPRQFNIINEVEESYVYQSENQLEILLTATESEANQNVYVFNTIAKEPSPENLTPFYRDAVEDGDSEVSDFFNNSSGLINEGNFEIRDDQTILLRYPWLGVAFFGENAVVINSVDQNLADVIRSQELQLGGSTLPPGEIPNLIYNVDGGIGVFGSLSTDTIITRFDRPPF
ncbi:MAG: DUF4249 family protein [Bacteroidetes bacterium]|jgi:hypothetical protein|nr:DUF4249 family protein [Bacteroidota bacterium]